MYAIIQHKRKQANLFSRKQDATYFHVNFRAKQQALFKEVKSRNQIPKGYRVVEGEGDYKVSR